MINDFYKKLVSLVQTQSKAYPVAPFHPHKAYPEFSDSHHFVYDDVDENWVYDSVRDLLRSLDLDTDNVDTPQWNPFTSLIKEGETVVIKPNLVIDRHPLGADGIEAMITHASIIRPLIDYIVRATNKNCSIVICDVPLQSAYWERLIDASGLKELVDYFATQGVTISLFDLRYEISLANSEGVYYKRIKGAGDPLGYQAVDLGARSYITDIIQDYKKLEITDYGKGTVAAHHNPEKNEYLLPKTILTADLFINVPKLKTHRKAGVTLSMKNLIGVNGDKSWIAHHRKGVDEYPYMQPWLYFKWYVAHYLKIYAPKWFVTLFYKMHRIICLRGASLKEHGMKKGAILMDRAPVISL